ncbi:dockerin type I domain-containing protein [Shewanella sp. 6_MG-2023]|uniref:dockerin type I domain-containing protein n=1 Tax=Shewanella sp. 6_MG-2023 TaxID=3062660 RepID=UPI0026E27396|nr:dockerin type I domain-containing protein [Shewanella sp. 6_MG-2023]MDO6618912.1 dockerin type I domain-containing protein [Shewanella sp. 6_MG-2023]
MNRLYQLILAILFSIIILGCTDSHDDESIDTRQNTEQLQTISILGVTSFYRLSDEISLSAVGYDSTGEVLTNIEFIWSLNGLEIDVENSEQVSFFIGEPGMHTISVHSKAGDFSTLSLLNVVEDNYFTIGDVNNDGTVSEIDLDMLSNYLSGLIEPSEIDIVNSDINLDGYVNKDDRLNLDRLIREGLLVLPEIYENTINLAGNITLSHERLIDKAESIQLSVDDKLLSVFVPFPGYGMAYLPHDIFVEIMGKEIETNLIVDGEIILSKNITVASNSIVNAESLNVESIIAEVNSIVDEQMSIINNNEHFPEPLVEFTSEVLSIYAAKMNMWAQENENVNDETLSSLDLITMKEPADKTSLEKNTSPAYLGLDNEEPFLLQNGSASCPPPAIWGSNVQAENMRRLNTLADKAEELCREILKGGRVNDLSAAFVCMELVPSVPLGWEIWSKLLPRVKVGGNSLGIKVIKDRELSLIDEPNELGFFGTLENTNVCRDQIPELAKFGVDGIIDFISIIIKKNFKLEGLQHSARVKGFVDNYINTGGTLDAKNSNELSKWVTNQRGIKGLKGFFDILNRFKNTLANKLAAVCSDITQSLELNPNINGIEIKIDACALSYEQLKGPKATVNNPDNLGDTFRFPYPDNCLSKKEESEYQFTLTIPGNGFWDISKSLIRGKHEFNLKKDYFCGEWQYTHQFDSVTVDTIIGPDGKELLLFGSDFQCDAEEVKTIVGNIQVEQLWAEGLYEFTQIENDVFVEETSTKVSFTDSGKIEFLNISDDYSRKRLVNGISVEEIMFLEPFNLSFKDEILEYNSEWRFIEWSTIEGKKVLTGSCYGTASAEGYRQAL